MKPRDLIVIGGGAGGLVVASVASQLGLEVTLIDKETRLGGDCLHYGCVPSKSLISVAKVAALMRRADEFGLGAADPQVNLGQINDHVRAVIDRIQMHDDPERFRGYGCEVLLGSPAEFVSPHEVRVGGRVIWGKRFVIATGSSPLVPPLPGLAKAGFLTSQNLFSLRDLPGRLLVLGGGPVGLEMAQAFARLGSQVTVVEQSPHLLPREDPELTDALRARLTMEGVVVHTSKSAERVIMQGEVRVVECTGGLRLEADEILVAAGRSPNVAGLSLEAAGIGYDAKGIVVDRRLRTSQKHIYACGDVCGPFQLTHVAEYQAGVIISNALFRFPKKADYRVVPRATFTDPELASVGLTEQQAREQGIAPEVLRFPFARVDRALTDGEAHGLIKLVTRKGKLLGASILGPHAGELIHEITLAMKTGSSLGDISATIHAYPTLSQAHRRAANTGLAKMLFNPATRRLVKWIKYWLP